MKKNRLIAFALAVICVLQLTVPAFALESASDQLAVYNMSATAQGDSIRISFSVTGNDIMNKIGCERIHIFERSGSKWVLLTNWDEDDEGMSRYNGVAMANSFNYPREEGAEYLVMIVIFAENDAGRDSRQQNFYVP